MNSGPCKDLERVRSRQREQQVRRVGGSKLGMCKEQREDRCGWALVSESHRMEERMLEK